MSWRRNLTLGLVSGGLALGGFAAAHGLAHARQSQVVVLRFLLGYFDGAGRFVPTAGRGATNVDRNAISMFVFSGPVDLGSNSRASLPLTIAEQAELEQAQAENPDFDPAANGYEPGVIPRKKSTDRAAFFVATGSVTTESVVIAAPQAGGAFVQAPGQFFKVLQGKRGTRPIQNRLLFNPRYAAATFNNPHEIDYNPQGLDAATNYEVLIDGGSNPNQPFELLRDLDGQPLGTRFSTKFTTTTRYVQDYTRPQIRSTSPTDGTNSVQSDQDIEITFNEPMDVGSFQTPRFQGDDLWTATARYTLNPINGLFQGRNLLLQVRVKPQTGGEVVDFRPLQGFGKGPSEIEVIVRSGVTDLSGNNIIREIKFTFKTVFNAAADQAGFFEEKFENQVKKEPVFTPAGDYVVASWNVAPTLGFLKGVVTDTPFVAASPAQLIGTGVNVWGLLPIQHQCMIPTIDMGGRARTITSIAWRQSVFSSLTFPSMWAQMGHANDIVATSGFPGTPTASSGPLATYYRDTPTLVVPTNTYSTVGQLVANYVSFPKFAQNFNFDGQNPVILEIAHGGSSADNRWQCDANFALNTNIYSTFATTPATSGTNRWYFDTKFTYLTPGAEAQSTFYDIGRDDARILPQQIVPNTQPQGTQVTFVWQGAKADVTTPTIPDLNTLTPWLTDVRQLSLYRYVRFRVTLQNNLAAKTSPQIDTILLPYTFK